jgi:hypothetical protein
MDRHVALNADGSRNPNARQAANARLSEVSGQFGAADCYQLGTALHYLTDSTQPMHTTGFSAASVPTMLHVAWETYVPAIQQQFPVDSPWDQRWHSNDPDQVFEQTARILRDAYQSTASYIYSAFRTRQQ